ncbi:hypothetical protein Pla52o_45950 [Novipirellula galeiformis]|uniref:Carboxypeptidase regulatory-like domain-containing protein n=1 Tax=Novipirellula galeiformis TaxID=2528004 RepID=A0A5C6C9F1_9BACT|nr:hypothetical protein [Novipirellula galeiformis]TWU20081.1 hypothetical protein Pla52o_45950 [Novipirellula galeiformis]
MVAGIRSCLVSLLLAPLLVVTIGCGGGDGLNRAEVRGKVSFEGAPVESGSIAFIPVEGTQAPSTGGAINQGEYHLARAVGPVVGEYRVEIRATRKTGRQVAAGEVARDPTAMIDEIEAFIPEKYNNRSDLTAEIQPDKNEIHFDLLGASQ